MWKSIIIAIYLTLLSGCSLIDIKALNEGDFYSKEFLLKIQSIQLIYKDGDKQLAIQQLSEIQDETITKEERAKKYNLKGVMLFSRRSLDEAVENFLLAAQLVDRDLYLKSNIYLNLSSSYFKLNKIELLKKTLESIDPGYLKIREKKNFYKLSYTIAYQQDDFKLVVSSLLFLTKDLESFKQFEDYKYREVLIDSFVKLEASQRVYLLDKNQKLAPVSVGYLAKYEAMKRFYSGDRSGSQDIVDWLEGKFSSIEDVRSFVKNYTFRSESFSKINSKKVGLIAPMSGVSSKYGRKVVAGVHTAMSKSSQSGKVNVYIKDNQGNELLARRNVQELVVKHHVSVIIGGLFPSLAKAEYLEARKYGVFYISLSPVYLPRSEKNHLLLEIPGSVESQISGILRPESLEFFGDRVAVLYPWSDKGKSYVNELWALHNLEKINLTAISHFPKGILDYRGPVKSLLGLKFPRERIEEFQIWSEIKNTNKRSVRIVNVLPPIIDFDWIFIPSVPKEALQIIPTFGFYDARNLKFIGGPSWLNKKLQKSRKSIGGKMYVIGNDTKNFGVNFITTYKEHNKTVPHLVDALSYESMSVVMNILRNQDFKKREDLGKRVLSFSELLGLVSRWRLDDGLWIKKMNMLEITSHSFKKLDLTKTQ